jgi:hypothetical protein
MLSSKRGPIPIFGFSCEQSYEYAERIAKYECVEHLWGHPDFYSLESLEDSLGVKSFFTEREVGTIMRKNLLLGAKDHRGFPRNATGLALGTEHHDPVQHAVQEVIERHCLFCWWQQRNLRLAVKEMMSDENRLQALLLSKILRGYMALKIEIDSSSPFISIGSAFRSSEFDAIAHAIQEAAMLRFTLQENLHWSRRHTILRTRSYAIAVKCTIEEILSKSEGNDYFEIPEINYATIYCRDGFQLVRAFSPSASFCTSAPGQVPSPFL